MALMQNSFDSGTVGNSVPASDSTNGTAFSGVETTLTFSSTGSHGQGAQSTSAAATASCRHTGTATSYSSLAARVYIRMEDAPTSDCALLWFGRNTSTRVCHLVMHSTDKLRAYDTDDAVNQVWESAATLSADTWYCLEMVCIVGTSTTTGTLKISYRALGDASAIETYDSGATLNLGGPTGLETVRFGKFTAVAQQYYIDSVAWNPGATDFIGPAGDATVAATAVAGTSTVQTYSTRNAELVIGGTSRQGIWT